MPFFKYKEKNIHYKIEGSGEAVVLIHGFLENLDMWDEISEALSKTHQVVRLDLPGFGKSECIEETHSMELFAECTHQLLLELNIQNISLIGHSMGGYTALELAERCPEKIKHLILFHSTALADTSQKKKDRNRAIKAVNEKQSVYLKTAIPFLFPEPFRESFSHAINTMISAALSIDLTGITTALTGMQKRKDHRFTLQNLRCKKTYVAGALDPLLDYQSLKKEAIQTKSAFVEIPHAGHMSHIENQKACIRTFSTLLP